MSSSKDCAHHEKSGFTSGIFMGVVVGAAVGYYFSTEQGKEILAKLTKTTSDKIQEISENKDFEETIQVIEEKVEQAREAVSEAANKVAEVSQPLPKKSLPKPRFFQRSGNPLKS